MYRPKARGVVLFLCTIVSASGIAHAAIPLTINHQGIVKVDGLPFTGNGLFKFGFFDGGTNNWLWTNDGTQLGSNVTNKPTSTVSVSVDNGIYNVLLGDSGIINMVALPSSVFDGDDVLLRVIFNDGSIGEQVLSPDQPLSSAAFAYHAAKADTAIDADTVDGLHAAELGLGGYLYGGVIANGSGGNVTFLSMSAVTARDDADTLIIRAPAMTKRVDDPWVAGTGLGGLDTGTISASQVIVYIWVIADSTAVNGSDYLFSLSGTSPTLPSGYDKKRLLGGRVWEGTEWRKFLTVGNGIDKWVYLDAPITVLSLGSSPSAWTDVDVSAEIPTATCRLIEIIASMNSNVSSPKTLQIRTNGSTAVNILETGFLSGHDLNTPMYGIGIVLLDISGIYEFKAGSTTSHSLRAYLENL